MVHTSTLKLKSITQKHVQYMQILHHDPFSNSDKYTRYASSEQQGVSPSEVLLLDAFKQFHNFEDYDSMLEYFETYLPENDSLAFIEASRKHLVRDYKRHYGSNFTAMLSGRVRNIFVQAYTTLSLFFLYKTCILSILDV